MNEKLLNKLYPGEKLVKVEECIQINKFDKLNKFYISKNLNK